MGEALIHIKPDDAKAVHSDFPLTRGVIPLPPESLMWSVGARSVDRFLIAADIWGQIIGPYLHPGCSILDLGCGCGRAARQLLPNACVSRYIGVDVVPSSVQWCQHHIQSLWPQKATFYGYDLYSAEYNPAGKMQATELTFPCAIESVDLVIGASLFTHLLEPDARHYLRETVRVLNRKGRAFLSIHTNPAQSARFSGTEARIDIAPDYFLEIAGAAGLVPFREAFFTEHIGNPSAQLIFAFCKK
jgi:SAM-dependent methyltransferase